MQHQNYCTDLVSTPFLPTPSGREIVSNLGECVKGISSYYPSFHMQESLQLAQCLSSEDMVVVYSQPMPAVILLMQWGFILYHI